MQAPEYIQHFVNFDFLLEVSEFFVNQDSSDFERKLSLLAKKLLGAKHLNIFIYNKKNKTVSDFNKRWHIISDPEEYKYRINIFNALQEVRGEGFILNDKIIGFNYDRKKVDEALLLYKENLFLALPISDNKNIIGSVLIFIDDNKNKNINNSEFVKYLKLLSNLISAIVVNIFIKEDMQLEIAFHRTIRDISKLIETQFELNYIVPLMGEKIDKLISDHLIYIFIKKDNKLTLSWPSCCESENIFSILDRVERIRSSIITKNKLTAAFPITSKEKILGVLVSDSCYSRHSDLELYYLKQLACQISITLNKTSQYAEILKYATIDPLTCLSNRRNFNTRLIEEINASIRTNSELCCMMIDIDYFKKINDTFGHIFGDKVLKGLANIIKGELRVYDIAARYGGEEFCVLLPNTIIKDAQLIALRLLKKIEKSNFTFVSTETNKTKDVSITISIGISKYNFNNKDFIKFIEDADKALYKAKQEGRNRVVIS